VQAFGIRELKEHATDILRRVREEGATFEVTYRGRVIAQLVPVGEPASPEPMQSFWDRWDALSAEIGDRWPEGVSAVDAVRESRRDL
jgi:prevent-host-death family protein